MLEKVKDMMGQFHLMQKLMKDENFKRFISHPKVQELFGDPDFKEIAKSRDFSKIIQHPKFRSLMSDPEVAPLMAKINPQNFMNS